MKAGLCNSQLALKMKYFTQVPKCTHLPLWPWSCKVVLRMFWFWKVNTDFFSFEFVKSVQALNLYYLNFSQIYASVYFARRFQSYLDILNQIPSKSCQYVLDLIMSKFAGKLVQVVLNHFPRRFCQYWFNYLVHYDKNWFKMFWTNFTGDFVNTH